MALQGLQSGQQWHLSTLMWSIAISETLCLSVCLIYRSQKMNSQNFIYILPVAMAMPLPPHHLLLQKIQNGLLFRCQLTLVVLEKRPLNRCSSSSNSSSSSSSSSSRTQFSSDYNAISYALLILWITSCLPIMGQPYGAWLIGHILSNSPKGSLDWYRC